MVLDLVNREYRLFFIQLGTIVFILFSSVVLLYNYRIVSIFEYTATILNYSNSSAKIEHYYPVNVSIANMLEAIYELMGYEASQSKTQAIISAAIIILLISCLLYPRSGESSQNLYPIFFLGVFGISGVVQPYYLLFANTIVLLTLMNKIDSKRYKLLMMNFLVSNSFSIFPLLNNWEIVSRFDNFDGYNQVVVYNLVPIFVTLIYTLIALQIHFQNINKRLFEFDN